MSIVVNGTTIGVNAGDLVANGVNCTKAYDNGVLVWEQKAAPGSQTFTSSGTFTVPVGYTEVTICMIGGGGSGACDDNNSTIGGGYAGQMKSQVVSGLTGGQNITVTIGSGGGQVGTGNNGLPGTTSSFGTVTASGGLGGSLADNYMGDGGIRPANCHGTYYDGVSQLNDGNRAYGGQGGFGNGGYGAILQGQNGQGYGSGGGAGYGSSVSIRSGAGANGYCRVSWS